ncbi:MAG: substrate-binding domain-containing protein [Desulfobacterales bacterium]|jgi:ABC-type sugar transport system substrate-binding protein
MAIVIFTIWWGQSFMMPAVSRADNDKTVALVMKALTNPFFSKMEAGARQYAQAKAIPLEVFGVERETDVELQISIVERLITRGVGAIVIAPADSKKLVGICKRALDKGIVVVNIDNPFDRTLMDRLGISIPFIGSDNFVGGQMIGAYLKTKLKGRGRVLVIEGIRGVANADLRKKGFVSAIQKDSAIVVVDAASANWHTDEAFSVTTKLLAANPSINAIFCANDAMALGALQAIDLMGSKGDILIAGYDNIESVRAEIRNGRIQATIEQHPELMGEYGIASAWQRINGSAVADYKTTPLDLVTYEHFNKTAVVSVSTLENSFFSIMVQGAREAATLFGLELMVFDAKNQDAQQLTDIAAITSREVDVLIVNPTNSESIAPGIEFAHNFGIPVITVDRKASEGKVLCHIESDNVQGGRMAANILAQMLDHKGRILEMEGIPGTSAAHERGAGFNEALGKFNQIEVAYREVGNFDRLVAKAVTLRILDNNGRIDGVFAHNDNMILGVIDAFEASGLKLPKALVGFDAIPAAEDSIRKGKLSATIAQKPKTMGWLAIETAARHFRGEPIPALKLVELKLVKH